MPQGFPKSDWMAFRELHEVTLERLCKRILDEAESLISNSDKTHHERFSELFDFVDDRNHDIARAFDNPRRSAMMVQLSVIHSLGLLDASDLARFSEKTRETIEHLAGLQ